MPWCTVTLPHPLAATLCTLANGIPSLAKAKSPVNLNPTNGPNGRWFLRQQYLLFSHITPFPGSWQRLSGGKAARERTLEV
ncbi:unnamed protein product [Caretta caretta]